MPRWGALQVYFAQSERFQGFKPQFKRKVAPKLTQYLDVMRLILAVLEGTDGCW